METFNLKHIYHAHYKKDGSIPYEDYRSIVEEMNQLAMDEVITKGHRLLLKNNLGPIYVEYVPRSPKVNGNSINWKDSLIRRQQLLDQGIVPYNKETAPEGKKWFVLYDTDYIVRFQWSKLATTVPNYSMYSFTPTRGAVGNKTKLKNFITEDPDRVFIYRRGRS